MSMSADGWPHLAKRREHRRGRLYGLEGTGPWLEFDHSRVGEVFRQA